MKRIISVQIKNSTFYSSPFQLNFSNNLNCIMGGRGTGKSTLLHFLKSCLDPYAEESKTTYNVLRNNLGNGTIILEINDENGNKYRVEKSIEDEPIAYDSSGNFADFSKVKKLIQCDIYEAQAIEAIGNNSNDRLELIDKTIISEKVELLNGIEQFQFELDENAQLMKSENAKLNQLNNSLKFYESSEDELTVQSDDLDHRSGVIDHPLFEHFRQGSFK